MPAVDSPPSERLPRTRKRAHTAEQAAPKRKRAAATPRKRETEPKRPKAKRRTSTAAKRNAAKRAETKARAAEARAKRKRRAPRPAEVPQEAPLTPEHDAPEAQPQEQALGMSNGALYMIGLICGVFSAFMVYQANSGSMASPTGGYVFAAVLGAGAVGCFARGSLQGIMLRLIGAAVLLTCIGYVIGQATGGPVVSDSRADPSLMNSIKALLVFGIPAGYLMVRGPHAFDLPGEVRKRHARR